MKIVEELDDTELRRAYVVACKQYNNAYKNKKEIEEEMCKRFELELDSNR